MVLVGEAVTPAWGGGDGKTAVLIRSNDQREGEQQFQNHTWLTISS